MVPFLSIQSQRGLISVESEPARVDIRRPRPDVHVESTLPVITANNGPGELIIDQSRSLNALTGGKPDAFWKRIYSQYKDIALQNRIRIVEEGNRLGDLRISGNLIPDLALDEFVEGAPDLQVYGEASPDNVDIDYVPRDLNMQVQPGKQNMNVQVHRPEVTYHRGSVKVEMMHYPKVTITPPQINIRV
ncbi:DUF6470 family protein [Cohnella luojiensis]|uniref:Uncharacterized protein n=1 Tax=Cohnella luojiensis TaxID=652876 RepID=A0A4Y8M3L6_9BACL|nr:DUF6470 family protein [Cohnella luojiensis]TFE29028.1 hypothetical protein E2980_06480 [Cohnella luojiensis]